MFIFDAHADTLSRMLLNRSGLTDPGGHIDLERLIRGGIGAQIFASFVHPLYYVGMALHTTLEMIDVFWRTMERHPQELGFAGSGSDIERLRSEGKIACLLSVEGGEALEGKLAHLRMLHRLGVRLLTLTWEHRNAIGSGQTEGTQGGGLSIFGREVIEEMNHLKMLVDVSHLNDPGFWDALKTSKTPIVASHSNAREICPHTRNLTDEQIKAVADRGGVIGVNFFPYYLVASGQATLEDVVDHICHIAKVGGVDCVGLGSDFDGIGRTPEGLEDCSKTSQLAEALKQRGYQPDTIEKIMGGNFLRLVKEVLG